MTSCLLRQRHRLRERVSVCARRRQSASLKFGALKGQHCGIGDVDAMASHSEPRDVTQRVIGRTSALPPDAGMRRHENSIPPHRTSDPGTRRRRRSPTAHLPFSHTVRQIPGNSGIVSGVAMLYGMTRKGEAYLTRERQKSLPKVGSGEDLERNPRPAVPPVSLAR
jgi:hypothetical protein